MISEKTPILTHLPNVFCLHVPTPFIVGPVNCYCFSSNDRESFALLDPGPFTEDAMRSLRQQLETLHFSMDDLDLIICTHAHSDHFGMIGALQSRRGNMSVAFPEKDIPLLSAHRGNPEEYWAKTMRERGFPEEKVQQMARGMKRMPQEEAEFLIAQEIDEGMILEVPGRSLEVLLTPGHTSGHICLRDVETGVIFCGDHVLDTITPNVGLAGLEKEDGRRLEAYLDSLKRLSRLSPPVLYPGHRKPVQNPIGRMMEILELAYDRSARVAQELDDRPKTPYDMIGAVYPENLSLMNQYLATMEVAAHLDYLVLKEKAISVARDPVRKYKRRLVSK